DRVSGFEVHWRGPLAFARWRDSQGARQWLVWWPDTLPAGPRRELRLAVSTGASSRHVTSMAT
ncbi:MAG: hypothetical protein M3374_00895, partial [Pseudomonadota bacterium]|nr:hypothetical protein [Pseudomonadota bacterium]